MVPNLRVDARIYHTDNTTAVKKATRLRGPQHQHTGTPGLSGFTDEHLLTASQNKVCKLVCTFLVCLRSMLLPCVGWGLISEVSLRTGRRVSPSPCCTEANTSRCPRMPSYTSQSLRIIDLSSHWPDTSVWNHAKHFVPHTMKKDLVPLGLWNFLMFHFNIRTDFL